MICDLYSEPLYLIFSADAPKLLYYSHIPAIIIALLVGFFVIFKNFKELQNKLLFTICLCFAFWAFVNLILWTNIHSDVLLFAWSFLGVLASCLSIFSIYFIYVFLEKKDLPLSLKILFIVLLAPVFIFAHTNLSLQGFNLTQCDAFAYEGIIYKNYHAFLGVLAIIWIACLLIRKYRQTNQLMQQQILLVGIGLEAFLILFFGLVYVASYLTTVGIESDSNLEFYGLFGMIIFVVFIGISMVRYKTFNAGLLASQALVIAMVILVGSQFTFLTKTDTKILAGITLILTTTAGLILNRSVLKQIKQRNEIQSLVTKLEKANKRLKQIDKHKSEFVSIASHQLRSPLTSIAGYASLLREGTYGQVPNKMSAPLERIEASSHLMTGLIEDYLNVSRIEAGNMKYNLSDFNLRDEVEHICDDKRAEAVKLGIMIIFKTDLKTKSLVNADIGKVQQIIHNLLNNALKYTQKGTVNVVVRDDRKLKKVYVDIIDTGIGMSTETMDNIFQKFSRGADANSINVKGTGLGLFVAQKMAEAMGGTIGAHSAGEGRGSCFTLELPLIA